MDPENQLSKFEEQFTIIYDIKEEPAEEYELELPGEEFESPENYESLEDQFVEYEALEEYLIDPEAAEDSSDNYEPIPMDPEDELPALETSSKEPDGSGSSRSEDLQTGDKSHEDEVMLEELPVEMKAEVEKQQEPKQWISNPDLIFCKNCRKTFKETQGLGPRLGHMQAQLNNCVICRACIACPEFPMEHKHFFHKCAHCNMQFMKEEDLKAHNVRAKHGTSKWSSSRCLLCPKSFLSQSFLDKHMKNKHPDPIFVDKQEQPLQTRKKCGFCSKQFVKQGMLYNHVRLCHNRSYVCALCKQKFTDMSLYIEHKKIHVGHARFKCLKCGHCFETQKLFDSHQGKCRKYLEAQLCNSLKARLLKRQK